MSDLLAEIEACGQPKGERCTVAIARDSLDAKDREALDRALDRDDLTATAIATALRNRGLRVAAPALRRHRKKECLCEQTG